MIILDATTKSLQFKLGGTVTTNQLPFSSSYIDTTGTGTTPGEQDGVSNNTTAVTVVSSPASSTQRLVKSIVIQNADTVATTVTVIYNNNSTLRNIVVTTLNPGDQLTYEDGNGWSCVDKNGNLKTTGSTSPGGSSGQVQYNNAGALGGLANGQLPATATNDNASAGNVGEYVSSYVINSSSVSVASSTPTNLTSISLTAGDWDVYSQAIIQVSSGKTLTLLYSDINTTSAAFDSNSFGFSSWLGSWTGDGSSVLSLAGSPRRLSLSTTTTVYLVVQQSAPTSQNCWGGLWARRAR
jgi:hypothetical protein